MSVRTHPCAGADRRGDRCVVVLTGTHARSHTSSPAATHILEHTRLKGIRTPTLVCRELRTEGSDRRRGKRPESACRLLACPHLGPRVGAPAGSRPLRQWSGAMTAGVQMTFWEVCVNKPSNGKDPDDRAHCQGTVCSVPDRGLEAHWVPCPPPQAETVGEQAPSLVRTQQAGPGRSRTPCWTVATHPAPQNCQRSPWRKECHLRSPDR